MSKYLEKQRQFFDGLGKQIRGTGNRLHQKILQNFQWHFAYEFAGQWDRILEPDMTVEEPKYRVIFMGLDEVYEGRESVLQDFYSSLNADPSVFHLAYDAHIAVSDWGVASFHTLGTTGEGERLAAQGFEIDDPDGSYLVEMPLAMHWPYAENGRLLGEDIYQIGEPTTIKLATEDSMSKKQMVELASKYLPE